VNSVANVNHEHGSPDRYWLSSGSQYLKSVFKVNQSSKTMWLDREHTISLETIALSRTVSEILALTSNDLAD